MNRCFSPEIKRVLYFGCHRKVGLRLCSQLQVAPVGYGPYLQDQQMAIHRKGYFSANFRYQPCGWKRARRFVVIERNEVPQTGPVQLPLFDFMDGRYKMICTNQRLKAENIWRLNNKGAMVEQLTDELKNDLSATGIRTDSFWANDALFISGLVAYNLLNCIRCITLPKAYHTARIKQLGFLFFQIGAHVVRRARGFWNELPRSRAAKYQNGILPD